MISIGEFIAARHAERNAVVPRAKRAKKAAPARHVAAAKRPLTMNKLHELHIQKEALREEFKETVAAEKQLKEEARKSSISRRAFVQSMGACGAMLLPASAVAVSSVAPFPEEPCPASLEPIFQIAWRLEDVRSKKRQLRRQLKRTALEIHLILCSRNALDFIHQILIIQIPWYLAHGCHPPETQKPIAFSFFSPGLPCLTV
jgi:hypothetical protein